MQKQKFIEIQDEFPDTHFLIYHGKKYPIKYDFFKISSKFFLQNHELFEQNKIIPIFNDNEESEIDLTDENIKIFINFIQHKKVAIDNENVVSLNYLANKFEVTSLINFTKDYISENHDDLSLQILLIHQNDQKFETQIYETTISQNLPFYVKDERLLDLKISILYRIFSEFFTKNKKQIENKEINDFLFKCLDKYGREASSLFTYVDFGKSKNEYLTLLLKKYSEIFDFHFINPSMMKALYVQQSEIIRRDEEERILHEEKFKMLNDEIEKNKLDHENEMKNLNESFQSKIDELKKMIELKNEQNIKQNEMNQKNLKKFEDEHMKEIKSLKESFQSEIDELKKMIELKNEQNIKQDEMNQKKFKDEIEKIKLEHNKQLDDLNQKHEKGIDSLKNEIKILQQTFQSTINEIKNEKAKSFEYVNGHEFEGIFNYLNTKCGGNSHLNGLINITSNGDEHYKCYDLIDPKFTNWFYPSENPNSYVQFDFKERKVSISKYSLKNKGMCCYKLINWEVVGSNDGDKWTQIDERHINEWSGDFNVSTYSTHSQEFYRYIKICLKGPDSSNNYNFLLSSIELFGKLNE